MERMNDTAIKKAAITVRHLEGDEKMREIIRRREDAQFLERSIRYAGYKDGEKQGLQKGLQKGLKQANLSAARAFLKMGLSAADVAAGTGLPLETILSIKP